MDNIFLFVSLFIPRISLVWYYFNGWIPPNSVPFIADFFGTLLIPRILLLIYIGMNLGVDSGWFIAHLIFAILAYCGGGGASITVSRK